VPLAGTGRQAEGRPVSWPPVRLGASATAGLTYAALALLALVAQAPGHGLFWCANGVAIVLLLRQPRAQWPVLLAAIGLAGLVVHGPGLRPGSGWMLGVEGMGIGRLVEGVAVQLGHVASIALGAFWLQRSGTPAQAISRPSSLAMALFKGAVVPAAAGAALTAALLAGLGLAPFGGALLRIFDNTLVGTAVVLPFGLLLLAWPWPRLRAELSRPPMLPSVALVLVVSLGAPLTVKYPFFHILLVLLLVAAVGRFAGAALGVLVSGGVVGVMLSGAYFESAFRSEQMKEVLFILPRLFDWAAPGQPLHFVPMFIAMLPPLLLAATRERIELQVEALAQREAHFRHLYERTPAMMHSVDVERRLLSVNNEWLARLGYTREEVIGRPSTEFLTPESRRKAEEQVIPRFMREGQLRDMDYQMLTKTGEVIDVHLSAIWETDADGRPVRTLSVLKDVTEQNRLAAELAAEKERIEVTLHSIGDGVVTTDAEGRIHYLNPVAEALVGWSLAEARGRPFGEVVDLYDQHSGEPLPSPLVKCLQQRQVHGLPEDAMLRNRQGQAVAVQDSVAPIISRDGALHGAVMVFQDVTEARGLAQRMSYLALHDGLTGLPNRVLFEDRVHQACQFGLRHQARFAVVFMDLDHFKRINDSLGHAAGDRLLTEVATRLKATLRGSDTVCRLGGDEFVMLLGEITSAADAAEVANKVLRSVAQPVQIDGQAVEVGMSLGLALFPTDGTDPATLMRHADTAMYRAKREGRNRCCFYAAALAEPPGGADAPAYSGT